MVRHTRPLNPCLWVDIWIILNDIKRSDERYKRKGG